MSISVEIISKGSKAYLVYKAIIYLFVFVTFFILIIFPIMYSSISVKSDYSIAFVGVFVAIPTPIAMIIALAVYAVVLVFLTYKTVKFDKDLLYLLGEALFMSYILTTIVALLFPGSMYQGNPETYNKELLRQAYSVLIAPFFEEFFFRLCLIGIPLAFIMKSIKGIIGKVNVSSLSMRKKIAVNLLIAISSVSFGIAHSVLGFWGIGKAFVATIQGIYLSVLFIYFGFLANLSLHFIVNALSFLSLWAIAKPVSSTGLSAVLIAVSIISIVVIIGSVLSVIALPLRIIEKARAMKIIVIVGYPGAGKTEVRKIIEELYGIKGVAMGDIVRMQAQRFEIPMDPKEISRFADSMRRIHGMDYWARKTVEYINDMRRSKSIGKIIVIDGVRNIEEVEYFKRIFGENLVIIAVNAPDELRFKRLLERGRQDEIKTIEDLRLRDDIERSWGLDKVIGMADFIIENSGTIEELKESVKSVLDKILSHS